MCKKYLLYVQKYILSNKWSFIGGIFFSILKSIISLLVPLTFSAIVDQALSLDKFNLLTKYSILMIVGYITMCATGIGRDYFIAILDESFIKKSRVLLLKKINNMKYCEVGKIDNGQIMAKYSKEIEIIQEHFGEQFTNILPNLLVLIYCSVFIIFTNIKVLVASLLMIALYIAINRKFGKMINESAEENMRNNAETIGAFSDYFSNVFLTKIYVLYKKIESKFNITYSKFFKSSIKIKVLFSMNTNFSMMVLYISSGIMWFVCGLEIMKGNMTIGQLTVIISYQGMLLTPLSFFSEYNGSLKRTMAAIDRMENFLKIDEEEYQGEIVEHIKTLKFHNVSFGYGKEMILQNLNFSLERGKIYAICGPSGCGKTTITKLLLRLYECTDGEVQCNDTNIIKYDLNMYRSRFSVMSQEPSFYEDTLWENIIIDKYSTKENIVELSKRLDIYEDIQSFSGGFEFMLTKNAGNISGGQKKRIDALRAFSKSYDVFIFDEGTNGLDKSRKKILHNFLKQMKKDKIVIIISHDLEDLNLADILYTIKDKEVK